MKQTTLPLILFLALAGLFWLVLDQMNSGTYDPRDIPSTQLNQAAPAFSLPDLLKPNQQVRPADNRGKIWLLNVWGTWCPECWREHAFLVELANQGVPIVGLNWRDQRADAVQMLTQLGNPFVQIGFDPNSQAAIEWGVYGAPETFLIDAEGIIRVKYKGALNAAVWQKHFVPFYQSDVDKNDT